MQPSNSDKEPINRDVALALLTSVFPELKQHWDNYLKKEYSNYREDRLDYVDIGELTDFIVKRKKNDNTSGFDVFFEHVETILVHGDIATQELIVIGLLEGIQNRCGLEVNYYTGFNEWLKPETKKAWEELIRFWEGDR